MRVSLYVTCLVDQLWPAVGEAAVTVLERAGCEVHFDGRQTCCGQPAFNSGYRREARDVVRRQIEILEEAGEQPIVLPSGSCAAMIHHWPELFSETEDREWHGRARAIADRTFEIGTFLVRELGRVELGARFEGRVSWHDACHGLRDLGIREEPRRLLGAVDGLELVESSTADTCCGFGGTFSVGHPELSVAMLDRKLEGYEEIGVDAIVSADVSCLMHIEGRLRRRNSGLRCLHLFEILAAGQREAAVR